MSSRPDPLATLARLRRLETDLGRQHLARRGVRLDAAGARATAAGAALSSECAAEAPADYAAWLARGLAERERAALALRLAQAEAAEARARLASARSAQEALATLMAQRAQAEARRTARRAERALDDFVAGACRRKT